MIGLLVQVLILCLVFGVLWWAISMLPLPPPFGVVAQVLLLLVLALILLGYLLPIAGHPLWGWR